MAYTYGIVCQMYELIADLLRIIVQSWEANIALVVKPDGEWVKVSDKYPLAYVELPLENDKRVLDVLLRDPQRLLALYVILDLHEVVVADDSSSSREPCWLQDPYVVVTSQVILRIPFFIICKQLLHLLLQLIRLLVDFLCLACDLFRLLLLFIFFLWLLGIGIELPVDGL